MKLSHMEDIIMRHPEAFPGLEWIAEFAPLRREFFPDSSDDEDDGD